MKKLFILALAAMTLLACNDKKQDEPQVTPSGTTDPTDPSGGGTGGGGGESGSYADFAQLQGQAYYVFFLQEGPAKYLGNKVLYSFGPNDHPDEAQGGKKQGSRWLYTWEDTFQGGTPVGADPFDGAEGWVSMVQIASGTWAGMGLCTAINDGNNVSGDGAAEDLVALNSLKENIKNYDEWYLALAIKNSVQGAGYTINLIGSNIYNSVTGKGEEFGVGSIVVTPKATGEWDYQEFQLSKIPGLEFGQFTTNGSNIISIVATPYKPGTQIDLGYAFLYKK